MPEATVDSVTVAPTAKVSETLPLQLWIDIDRTLLVGDETATLLITLQSESDFSAPNAIVTILLPQEIATVDTGERKVLWQLPAMAAGAIWKKAVGVRTSKLQASFKQSVGEVTVTVEATGYAPVEEEILLASAPTPPTMTATQAEAGTIFGSEDGDIMVLAGSAALPTGSLFRYSEVYNWETITTTAPPPITTVVLTTASLATVNTAAVEAASVPPLDTVAPMTTGVSNNFNYLPLAISVVEPTTNTMVLEPTAESTETREAEATAKQLTAVTNEPMARADHNLTAYRIWRLEAQQAGQDVHALDAEVLVQVSIQKLLNRGLDPNSLTLWTREGESGRWTPVSTTYNQEHGLLQAWVPHFSQFGLGAGLLQSGDMLPSIKAFTVDELNGGANVHIPLEAPKGLGGLGPDLSLSYSSITLDDLFRKAGASEIEAQAGAAGIGWHLGGMSYIARTDDNFNDDTLNSDKKFALVLGGTRVGIAWQDGKWRTNPEIFAKLEWSAAVSGRETYKARDFGGWTVWTTDGTKYEFGDSSPFPTDFAFSATSANATALEKTTGGDVFRLTKRWYLRKVTDPLGNSMEYSYQNEKATERGCTGPNWTDEGHKWHTRTVDPTVISWNGQGGNYTLRALFSYTSRPDSYVKGISENDCLQPLYSLSNRLTDVTIQVYSSGSWATLRRYRLTQGTKDFGAPKSRLYLQKVEQLSASGRLFKSYTFSYTFYNANRVLLRTVTTNFGGTVTYTYKNHRTSCNRSVCPHSMDRYPVITQKIGDGSGNYRYVDYNYGSTAVGREDSAVADDGGFMGFEEITKTHYLLNSVSVPLTVENLESFASGASASLSNPHPLRGKLKSRKVRAVAGGAPYLVEAYDWKAYWLENGGWQAQPTDRSCCLNNGVAPITWIRLEKETQTTGAAIDEKHYTYEGAYGNLTEVLETANGVPQRKTQTEYYPNSAAWITNKPARVRIRNGANGCESETRYIYGAYYDGNGAYWSNVANNYLAAPLNTGLLVKTEQALKECTDTLNIEPYNGEWAITHMTYDRYGNQTTVNSLGNTNDGSQNVVVQTNYDLFYHLFPVEQWYVASPDHKETATYYGVNGLSLTDSKAFWGAMQEHCGVNEVCTRQSYDQFGRRVYRWEGVGKDSAWGANSAAELHWSYFPRSSTQRATTIVEEHNGVLLRKLYNGLGELVQEQRPYQDWTESSGQEIITDYLYDALGRQTRVGMPWLTPTYSSGDRLRNAYWDGGYTATAYDPINRPTLLTSPNGEQQQYNYGGRAYSLVGFGRHGDPNKILKWGEYDGLGNLSLVRTYRPDSSNWAKEGEAVLTYNALGNLRTVSHPEGIGTTTLTYDLAGRKIRMEDPDLGTWHYVYDRQGKLTRQTDARGKTICFYYDVIARLIGKQYRDDTACPATTAYDVRYTYDEEHSASNRSRGQVTSMINNGVNPKRLYYNSRGLLAKEVVTIVGAPRSYTTAYTYDSDLRPSKTTYPDGEALTLTYNAMGLPNGLTTNRGTLVGGVWQAGTLVDSVNYDAAGRVTAMRFPLGGNLWQSRSYFPWTGSNANANGRLQNIKVGLSQGSSERLALGYLYDSFGNISVMGEQYNGGAATAYQFCYDAQNRLTRGYAPLENGKACADYTTGRTYSYDTAGRFTTYEGTPMTPGAGRPHLSLPYNHLYSFDANGNATALDNYRGFEWDHENRLGRFLWRGSTSDRYFYDPDGQRVRKESGEENYYYPNKFYEQFGQAITKYYFFNGQRIAMRQGNDLYYLHHDHVNSLAVVTTASGAYYNNQGYWPYGRLRLNYALPTNFRFTDQRLEDFGLYNYGARFYDPETGQFISPDPVVPDPSNLFGYNRYMYVAGNPMRLNDSSGHVWETVLDAVSVGYDIYDIYNNGLNWENGLALAADVGGLAVPFVPSAGACVRWCDDAVQYSDEAVTYVGDTVDEGVDAVKNLFGMGDEAAETATDIGKTADNIPCPVNSFSAETLVATEEGLKPIDEVTEGELVYAYNEATGEVGLYPVTDEIAHLDTRIVTLTIDGERIYTTPEHPFYANGQWIDAGKLRIGDLVRRLDGSTGDVEVVIVEERPQVMYNLTVAEAHTFFAGEQQWLVHNCRDPVHHIATNKNLKGTNYSGGPWTPEFEKIFSQAGMDLNDALNKLAVPGHKGPHPEQYHRIIYNRLTEATEGLSGSAYKNALQNELNALRQEILDPNSTLNRIVTKR